MIIKDIRYICHRNWQKECTRYEHLVVRKNMNKYRNISGVQKKNSELIQNKCFLHLYVLYFVHFFVLGILSPFFVSFLRFRLVCRFLRIKTHHELFRTENSKVIWVCNTFNIHCSLGYSIFLVDKSR